MTDFSNSELARGLIRLEESQLRVESKLDAITSGFISAPEYHAWRHGIQKDIADLQAAKPTWWVACGLVISGIALAFSIVTRL